jgi:hypothetical protein
MMIWLFPSPILLCFLPNKSAPSPIRTRTDHPTPPIPRPSALSPAYRPPCLPAPSCLCTYKATQQNEPSPGPLTAPCWKISVLLLSGIHHPEFQTSPSHRLC